MVNLPSAWVKKHALKKGDELELLEEGPNLMVLCGNAVNDKHVDVALEDIEVFSRRFIYIPYIRGANSIRISFKEKSQFTHILQCVDKMLAFEITEQGEDYCIAKSIAEPVADEARSISLRLFHMAVTMGEDLLEIMSTSRYEGLSGVIEMDKAGNKLTRFCKRTVNKNFTEEGSTIQYRIFGLVEEIMDEMKDIAYIMQQKKLRLSPHTISLMRESISLIKQARTQYINFTVLGYNRLYKMEKKMKVSYYRTAPTLKGHEAMIAGSIKGIMDKVHHLVEELY